MALSDGWMIFCPRQCVWSLIMEVMFEPIWSMNYTDSVVPQRQYPLLWSHGYRSHIQESQGEQWSISASSRIHTASRRCLLPKHTCFFAKAGASRSSTGQRTWAKFNWEDVWNRKDASVNEIWHNYAKLHQHQEIISLSLSKSTIASNCWRLWINACFAKFIQTISVLFQL